MKHGWWRKWTVDRPAAFGDWLWDVFVVQLAAALDRVTPRDVIAFIPVVILIFAYLHRIPIPPELMLVGDLLAYIDVFAMVFLLSMIGRAGVVLYVLKRTIEFAISCISGAVTSLRRLDFRHRRAKSESHGKRGSGQAKQSDGDIPVWAFALSPASHVPRRADEEIRSCRLWHYSNLEQDGFGLNQPALRFTSP